MLSFLRPRRFTALPLAKVYNKFDSSRLASSPCIFSNEVENGSEILKDLSGSAGLVMVKDCHNDMDLGIATYNHTSLTRCRVLTSDTSATINSEFFAEILSDALSVREAIFDRPFYRLVNDEADMLPGCIIDRYGDVFIIAFETPGMARLQIDILAALKRLFNPTVVIVKNTHPRRELEGLPFEKPYVIVDRRNPDESSSCTVDIPLPFNRSISVDLLNYDWPLDYTGLSTFLADKSPSSLLDVNSRLGLSAQLCQSIPPDTLAVTESTSIAAAIPGALHAYFSKTDLSQSFDIVTVQLPLFWMTLRSGSLDRRLRPLLRRALAATAEDGYLCILSTDLPIPIIPNIACEEAASLGLKIVTVTDVLGCVDRPGLHQPHFQVFRVKRY